MDRCWPPRSLHSPPPRRRARCHAARPRTTPTTGSSTAAAAYLPFLRRHPPSLASWHSDGSTACGRSVAARPRGSKTQYVVMSQRLPAWRMLSITRRHWSVENHLDRQLDVVFREDGARTARDNAPGNLSVIRRMALDI